MSSLQRTLSSCHLRIDIPRPIRRVGSYQVLRARVKHLAAVILCYSTRPFRAPALLCYDPTYSDKRDPHLKKRYKKYENLLYYPANETEKTYKVLAKEKALFRDLQKLREIIGLFADFLTTRDIVNKVFAYLPTDELPPSLPKKIQTIYEQSISLNLQWPEELKHFIVPVIRPLSPKLSLSYSFTVKKHPPQSPTNDLVRLDPMGGFYIPGLHYQLLA